MGSSFGVSNYKKLTPHIKTHLLPVCGRVHFVLQHLYLFDGWMRRHYIRGTQWTSQHLALAEVLGLIERKEVTEKRYGSDMDSKIREVEIALGVTRTKPGAVFYRLTKTGEQARLLLSKVTEPVIIDFDGGSITTETIINMDGEKTILHSCRRYDIRRGKYKMVRVPVLIDNNWYNHFLNTTW